MVSEAKGLERKCKRNELKRKKEAHHENAGSEAWVPTDRTCHDAGAQPERKRSPGGFSMVFGPFDPLHPLESGPV